ncbi:MAG: hypothetical protein LH650_14545 [Chloroflexi bacterium]|nr:hypothetical protein [Chloroflexota bacterium]
MSLSTTRGHLFRTVLESVEYGFRHHLDVFAELGLTPGRVRVSDGGARSAVWRQVIADVIGMPLESLRSHPGSSLGVAFAAGMGVGIFQRWDDIDRFVEVGEVTQPHHLAIYDDSYRRYRELYPALRVGVVSAG